MPGLEAEAETVEEKEGGETTMALKARLWEDILGEGVLRSMAPPPPPPPPWW